ncbi:MAG: peptidoglycan DD-metalloendopeptidase family protein [Erysipelotrichaceae bacterium]|nr:peptidoglycan DD-metalloendopeptidase family protein [Erysipelotrichaceae bacterium]
MKTLKIFIVAILCLVCITHTNAEDDFSSNGDYYSKLCSQSSANLTAEEQSKCNAYIQYMSNQSSELRTRLKEIDEKREEIANNLQVYAAKIKGYDKQIAELRVQIDELNEKISVIENEINQKEFEINQQQSEIDVLKQRFKDRMVQAQKTLRLNPFLDILVGAKSFEDLIRKNNAINDIINFDKETLETIAKMIEELNKQKALLEVQKSELDTAKQEVVNKQNTLIYYRREAEIVRQEYLKKEADLEAEGNRIAGDLDAIKATISQISSALGSIAMSNGFVRPISGGRVSAGTWYYPSSFGGGVHLGMDFAAPSGTTIFAAGNGVVIKSVDGCGEGELGSRCGGNIGGSSGGGNQVYLLTKIDGSLYALKYLHMVAGSPIAVGTIVSGGDRIGGVGKSGNASGYHVHVEVFYLGTDSIANYAQNWNGDLAFGASWGSAALNRLCENGVGAPCRVKPESVFGG